ncbi:MAG: FkbM family methyltransferase [Desulfobacterales bacterium]|jgi:FkbM family methyltransferase|nr:FkbM family methyltransferase [Desulfobacterales bacterium]
MNDLKSCLGLLRSRAIYFWKPFTRRRLRRFYRQFVFPGSLGFDIGAHLGSRSRAFLDLGARVVALEPQPACAAYLRRRWRGERRFTLVPKAIGDQAGRSGLYVNRLNPTISTLSAAGWRSAMAAAAIRREHWENRVDVEVTTLDRLIEDYGMPDFCKIDVEGFEAQALAGLSRPIPALSFEFISFDAAGAKACLRRLTVLGGYRFNWSLRERLRLECPQWVSAARVGQMIDGLGSAVVSGDIYARLDP